VTDLSRPVEILLAAADLIEVDGWTQGNFHQFTRAGGCAHCADGSLYLAAGIHEILASSPTGLTYRLTDGPYQDWHAYQDAYEAASVAADRRAGRRLGIIGYNDQPDTTAADVVAALREAASEMHEAGR
jgi:hypothetical protein